MEARPDGSVETEPPKEQPLQLTPEELPVDTEDNNPHSIPLTEDIEDPSARPEDRTYVDADAEVTEPEERSMGPYDILRDDPFALIPQEIVERWDEKRLPQQPHPQPQPPDSPATPKITETPTEQPWSQKSPPFTHTHTHVEDAEDLVSAESQSAQDPDEFSTHDSEDE